MKSLVALVAALLVLLGVNSLFVVREGQSALLLQFGKIVRSDFKPGLHWKVPFFEQSLLFDKRILGLDAQPERYLTSEKKSVLVDFYVKWRIDDLAKFYQTSGGDEEQANSRLSPIVKDALRFEFNARPLHELIADGRVDITKRVRDQVNRSTQNSLGIEVKDVRIRGINFPEEGTVLSSVYDRMRAERKQVANSLRASGQEAGETIRANADRERQVLLADATREAQKTRGQGDAEAAQVYAQAYGKDPEFYAFTRSLEAYRASFRQGNGVLLLDPKSDLFRYFNDSDKD
ncbi:protease modulator HflC [Tahibacter amnicola]|uniref:Protein HflC n=1 Tax=Tahibacter amnicola TaxID=2976241 RepID=A0ABY6BIH9_9GAMM|nr:protease modulator HflC [Tahibacter amnicola]UXI69814.1 protease modulator HflC [Tahibacter amnicola]